ncbi:sigma-70 family RNA polymerase sigma factor [Pedobacter sp. HDW13]|uniref:sigma-70 family RNA polymerase sigma factor n=1 Tax=Pedobacter sp. HDW13 TaxID=2714940 RepID=UPI00140C059A|nr:sigma-70 family RNA polymerase sigma factor [Pedobacter sp. HDW13]QIL40427.1 sigma-70 family RNA polymerase sigma factor [Pedobacter sp. HDW13]
MDDASSFVSLDDLRKESTITLLEYMGMNEDEPATAELAFNIFYEKFSSAFMVVCEKACYHYKDLYDGLAEVIFNNALCNAYFKASQFKSDNRDPKKVDNDVKRWLYGIANNELFIELRKIKAGSNLDIMEDIMVLESEIDHEEPLIIECYEKEILNEALATLSDKERGILLMCYQYSEDGKNIPSNVIERINTIFNIKEPNRRQIKKRALEKLLQQVNYLQSKIKVKK